MCVCVCVIERESVCVREREREKVFITEHANVFYSDTKTAKDLLSILSKISTTVEAAFKQK